MRDEPAVLIWAPVGRDGSVIERLLSDAAISSQQCEGIDDLLCRLEGGAGAVIAQEGLREADLPVIDAWVKAQPSWSDFPFVLLSHRGQAIEQHVVDTLGNATVLERPVNQMALISAVSSARRARRFTIARLGGVRFRKVLNVGRRGWLRVIAMTVAHRQIGPHALVDEMSIGGVRIGLGGSHRWTHSR